MLALIPYRVEKNLIISSAFNALSQPLQRIIVGGLEGDNENMVDGGCPYHCKELTGNVLSLIIMSLIIISIQ